ncbi:hypothetical protein FRC19_010964 [Serendipita sp. 401]|nr:hypothetical protein FRC19_010964 [Serendipita sp. 401]
MLIIVAWVLWLAVNSALSGITPSTTEDATVLTGKTPAFGVTVGASNVGRSTPSKATPSPAPGRTLVRRVTAPPASQKQITTNSAPNGTARPFTGTSIASNEGVAEPLLPLRELHLPAQSLLKPISLLPQAG